MTADLAALIADHRAARQQELEFAPSQHRPPVAYTYDSQQRAMVPDDRPLVINPFTAQQVEVPDSATQSTRVGVPMSGRLLRYLGESYGTEFPWRAAFKALRATCRREHRKIPHASASKPYWRGSLCQQAVRLTVIGPETGTFGPLSAQQAAGILRLTAQEMELVLRDACRLIEAHIDESRKLAEKRARLDAGLGDGPIAPVTVHERHSQGGLHDEDCPRCKKEKAA